MSAYTEPPELPDLRPAVHAAAERARLIEVRLREAMARGEHPTPALLADALHADASLALLGLELLTRFEAAQHRAEKVLARAEAVEARLRSRDVRRRGWLFNFL